MQHSLVLPAGWFLAVAAQERRSPGWHPAGRRGRGLILLVTVFNARHHNQTSLVTSIVDALFGGLDNYVGS